MGCFLSLFGFVKKRPPQKAAAAKNIRNLDDGVAVAERRRRDQKR